MIAGRGWVREDDADERMIFQWERTLLMMTHIVFNVGRET